MIVYFMVVSEGTIDGFRASLFIKSDWKREIIGEFGKSSR